MVTRRSCACGSSSATVPGVELYAKAEWQNPGGSVKDRPAARMIAEGERKGTLTPEKVILDATSGNTGIAYAMIGAARGYRVRLCVPSNVTPERKQILGTYGAELIYTDPMDGSDGAIREARRLYAEAPDRYFYPDQYNNDGNWQPITTRRVKRSSRKTNGRVTHFVAGLDPAEPSWVSGGGCGRSSASRSDGSSWCRFSRTRRCMVSKG